MNRRFSEPTARFCLCPAGPTWPVRVCLITDFLDPETCRLIRAAMDRGIREPAEVFRDGATSDITIRKATLIEPEPEILAAVESRLDAARARISTHLRISLGTREGCGFVRYDAAGFYGPHRDVAHDVEWRQGARRRVSVIVFLNSSCKCAADGDFTGGELMLYPDAGATSEEIRVVPTRGWLVAFHADMLHEVQPVRAGTRDVIVDWYS